MRSTDGFSLIELLVSLIIFAWGALALIQLMLLTSLNLADGLNLSLANQQLSSLLEHRVALGSGRQSVEFFNQWQQQNQTLLPAAESQINTHSGFFTAHLTWLKRNRNTISQHCPAAYQCLSIKLRL